MEEGEGQEGEGQVFKKLEPDEDEGQSLDGGNHDSTVDSISIKTSSASGEVGQLQN